MATDVGQWALQAGPTGLTMVPPAAHAQRDRHVLWSISKLEDKVPVISGLPVLAFGIVGVGTPQAVDNGPQRITLWEFDEGASQGSVGISVPSAINCLGGGYAVRPGAFEVFNPSTVLFAEDVSSGTSFAAVMASNQGFTLGDWAIQVATFTHGSPGLPGRSFTIPGCTLTGAGGVPLNSAPQNSLGNHQYTFTDRGQVTAGAQTSAATAGGTTTTATTGGAAHVRISSYVPLTFGVATEADAATALSLAKALDLGRPTEAGAALGLQLSKALALLSASETDTAQPLALSKALALGRGTETDAALAVALSKTPVFGRATEADLARAVALSKTLALGRGTETDLARLMEFAAPAADYDAPTNWSATARTPETRSVTRHQSSATARSTTYTATTRES